MRLGTASASITDENDFNSHLTNFGQSRNAEHKLYEPTHNAELHPMGRKIQFFLYFASAILNASVNLNQESLIIKGTIIIQDSQL